MGDVHTCPARRELTVDSGKRIRDSNAEGVDGEAAGVVDQLRGVIRDRHDDIPSSMSLRSTVYFR